VGSNTPRDDCSKGHPSSANERSPKRGKLCKRKRESLRNKEIRLRREGHPAVRRKRVDEVTPEGEDSFLNGLIRKGREVEISLTLGVKHRNYDE